MELEDRIVVDKVEQLLRADGKSQDDLPRLEVLARPREHAGFDQGNHAVGNQFAVHREILAIHEKRQHRIRDASDARLQHGAILNQTRDVGGDGLVHGGDLWALPWRTADGRNPRLASSSLT